jgi:hypothetical protein
MISPPHARTQILEGVLQKLEIESRARDVEPAAGSKGA